MQAKEAARIGVDIGGTFTDVVLETPSKRNVVKLLTTTDAPEQAFLEGVREVLHVSGLTSADVGAVIHGTTLAVNALIERQGAKTALLTTNGHRDVLEIGTESRFDQYDLKLEKPAPLVPRVRRLAITERIGSRGEIIQPLHVPDVEQACDRLAADSVQSVAIGFLHSYRNDEHEQQAAEIVARRLPSVHISLSSEVSPEMREYERISTTVANAFIRPMMIGYLDRLEHALGREGFRCPLFLMQSAAGITTVALARHSPIRLVDSGPAGGVVYAAHVSRMLEKAGIGDDILAFDMGGTTAKVCLIDDHEPRSARSFEVARAASHQKGSGIPLRIPVVELIEIGAGGGSIASLDALGQVAVGPRSAGSAPGPACYGRGGTEPTVTDADLVLGRLEPTDFAGGQLRLDQERAEASIAQTLSRVGDLSQTDAARAIAETIDERMANAARQHCTESGVEPADRSMIVLGGAAPLHAARVARKLGINRIVVPQEASLGSAVGFLRAPIAFELVKSLRQRLDRFESDRVGSIIGDAFLEAESIVRPADPVAPIQRALSTAA